MCTVTTLNAPQRHYDNAFHSKILRTKVDDPRRTDVDKLKPVGRFFVQISLCRKVQTR